MMKCVFCDGKSNKGVHDICWKEFKGFMLSDRVSFDIAEHDEAYDEPKQIGRNSKDKSGRNIVEGLVLKTKLGDD